MNIKLLPIFLICIFSFKSLEKSGDGDPVKGKTEKPASKDLSGKTVKIEENQVVYTADGKVLTKELAANLVSTKVKTTDKDIANDNLSSFDKMALSEYLDLDDNKFSKPTLTAFKQAIKGYYHLYNQGKIKKQILTIIDFTKHSTQKRMWVIDMKKKEILFHNVVSHGRNSGREYATSFSNSPESFKSSLGFYRTAETYSGEHGLSLRIDGLEPGINDNARTRDIVIHGADYCDENMGRAQGYLGRSLGCPALPLHLSSKIINTIKNESCLFIYHEGQSDYFKRSKIL